MLLFAAWVCVRKNVYMRVPPFFGYIACSDKENMRLNGRKVSPFNRGSLFKWRIFTTVVTMTHSAVTDVCVIVSLGK